MVLSRCPDCIRINVLIINCLLSINNKYLGLSDFSSNMKFILLSNQSTIIVTVHRKVNKGSLSLFV